MQPSEPHIPLLGNADENGADDRAHAGGGQRPQHQTHEERAREALPRAIALEPRGEAWGQCDLKGAEERQREDREQQGYRDEEGRLLGEGTKGRTALGRQHP